MKMLIRRTKEDIVAFISTSSTKRSITAVILLIVAIPLTVFIAGQEQESRSRAADSQGFQSARTFSCGELLQSPPVGALEGDFIFRAPIKTYYGWETHRADGSIVTTDDMYRRILEGWPEMNVERVIEQYTLSCNLRFVYKGDCKAKVVGPGTSKENMLPQGQTTTIHIEPDSGSSGGCDETVLIRAQAGSSPPPDYPNVTPSPGPIGSCTDSDGGVVYNKSGLVTWNENGNNHTSVDTCRDSTTLAEYSCTDIVAKENIQNCPSGCTDRACPGQTGPTSTPGGLTPTPTSTPTGTAGTPTLTPTPGGTQTPLDLSLKLLGIGRGPGENPTPRTTTRTGFSAEVYNANNQLVATSANITITFHQSGVWFGRILLPPGTPTGKYSVKVKLKNFLKKDVPGTHTIESQRNNQIGPILLSPGDTNNDNILNVLDYNIIVSCFDKKANTQACGNNMTLSDLNDNGTVDGVDINIFLRSLAGT